MADQPKLALGGIRAVILDIEGTVAPITFVKETLFPYALDALPAYLARNWSSPAFAPLRAAFPADAQASPAALAAHVADLTARDVKLAPLKALQGELWAQGYAAGHLLTPLYDDVVPALEAWRGPAADDDDANDVAGPQGAGVGAGDVVRRSLAIFSSGSVGAQKMFFGHVRSGNDGEAAATRDLRPFFEPRWFDTVNAGPKFEPESYATIVGAIGVSPGEALFLSDHIKEVEAARKAGLHAVLVVRPGNPPQETDAAEVPIHSLRDLQLGD